LLGTGAVVRHIRLYLTLLSVLPGPYALTLNSFLTYALSQC